MRLAEYSQKASIAAVALLASLALTASAQTDSASAASCAELRVQINRASEELIDHTGEFRTADLMVSLYERIIASLNAQSNADPSLLTNGRHRGEMISAAGELASQRARRAQAEEVAQAAERHLEQLRAQSAAQGCDDDDEPPPTCAPAGESLLEQFVRTNRNRHFPFNRRDAIETLGSLMPQLRPLVVRIGNDGTLLDLVTGRPVQSPLSTPADPDYIQVQLGMGGVAVGAVYAADFTQFQFRNTEGPTTLMQLVGTDGRPVVSQAPGSTAADAAWNAWASTYFHLAAPSRTPGPVTTALPLAAAATAFSPAIRAGLGWAARALLRLGGIAVMRLLLGQNDVRTNCRYHVELAYTAPPINRAPSAGLIQPSKLRAFDFPPPPDDMPPPTGTDLPDTESGGGGTATVRISASTCSSIRGTWQWRLFVGDLESSKGVSYRYSSPLRTGWRSPSGDAQVFVHLYDSRETDPDSSEALAIWRSYVARLKQRALAVVAGSRARLIDSDGFGRGRPTKLEVQGPLAPGVGRMTVKPGCNIATPAGYQEHDTPG